MDSVILEYVNFVKKSNLMYFKFIMDKSFNREIFDRFIDTYISIRYYNDFDAKYKSFSANINYYMKDCASSLISEYDEYSDVIKNMFYLFQYVLYFDGVVSDRNIRDVIDEIGEYREKILGYMDNDFCDKLYGMLKEDNKKKNSYIRGFDSDRFFLDIKKSNKKDVFFVSLNYNIKFNRIYSDYAINKVYNSGIVNEDKLFITYYLVSSLILKNVISCKFGYDYIVSFPCSLFDKDSKGNRLISVIRDNSTMGSLVMLFSYSDYLKYKEDINGFIKDGFKVAIYIDDSFKYDDVSNEWMAIFSYIITDGEYCYDFDRDKVIFVSR